ncbi:AraC family transcriptional regulator [Streptomyces sp. ISL-11]|uniref:AraC family transcriptional regulator n=1 Tax=Streptomyces sp. ISL-11 TaxID=2819174 RepID=UPI001BEB1E14|nr:AraC family transcriptional regulator [Streptomyces sp. ISL-11]MBT2384936.1 AraC family transcriptional regulator [Streptomyces sp. ISL-11]
MDVLSDAIAALRTGRPYSALTEFRGTWRRDVEPFGGAGFHVVLEGTCLLRAAGGGGPVVLAAGDAVFLPHGTACTLTGGGEPAVLLCGAYRLDQARAHPLLADFPEVIHLPARHGRHPSLRATIGLLGDELRSPGMGTDVTLTALLELLLIYLMRAWYEERSALPGTGWCRSLADPAVGAALRALHDDPSRPWTVAALAARAGMSRAAFARRFTTLVGRPPLTYLTWWRLTLAARILRDTDAPLAVVAQRIGYTSQFAFANAFKRAYGVAAGRYRQARREDHQRIGDWDPAPAAAAG